MSETTELVAARPTCALALRNVGKRFGATVALEGVTLKIRPGTVHALVGENGAGKSTALGILSGRIAATSGVVEVSGQELPPGKPRAARDAGLAVIYQELTIIPDLDAAANVFTGNIQSRFGVLSRREMERRYESLCERVGVAPERAGQPAETMSVANQQILEILRALAFDAQMILFDEPTASLGIPERQALMKLIRQLRDEGKTMAFVSHNLDEVLEISDEISIFRNGRLIETRPRDEWQKKSIVRGMIGEQADNDESDLVRSLDAELTETETPSRIRNGKIGGKALEVEDLFVPGSDSPFNLSVSAGEIVGLGGLVGSGRTSVLRAIAGASPGARGLMKVSGEVVKWPSSARKARRLGIALLPEDRKNQGLALEMSGAMNVMMPNLRGTTRFGLVNESRARRRAAASAAEVGFDETRIGEPAIRLSGGNQQKLLLARWALCQPRILLVDEPTKGIDIGAKTDVLKALSKMAEEGMAIVLVSSELEEVALLSDRVIAMAEGNSVGTIHAGDRAISVDQILQKIFDVEEEGTHGIFAS